MDLPPANSRTGTSPVTKVTEQSGHPIETDSLGSQTQKTFSEESLPASLDQVTQSNSANVPRQFATGQSIDHFVLVRKLGEGGFGQVWLANDTRLRRQVAIKLPHRSFRSDSREAKRFYREAETSAQLTHPNLVPILDAVLKEEQSYIVSEYCPGPTLMRWISDNSKLPTPKTAISIVAQVASGLNVAHQLGLIHRDIKPSNIILTDADTDQPIPRLTDFGLARTMSDAAETRTGALVGSGPYMSPEQASGNIDEHGPHSDVHALGILLYELLTRQSPFASANEMDTLRRIISLDPPSIRDIRPTVSRDISAVCQRCLEKSPSRRYKDAGELHADLQRLLDGQPPHARPVGRIGRLTRWAGRNVAVASLGMVALVSVVIAIVGLAAYAIQSQQYARRSETQTQALRSALDVAKKQRTDAITQRTEILNQRTATQLNFARWRRTSYTSDISSAFLRFNQGYLGDTRRLLDRQRPTPGEKDLRTIEWWVLDQQTKQSYSLLGYHGEGANDCRLLNNETQLLTLGEDGEFVFWDTATERPIDRLGNFGSQLTAVAVLPNGDFVIPGSDWPWIGRCVQIIDATTGRIKDALHAHPTTIDAIEVSNEGDVIASASRYESIRFWFPQERRSVTIENGKRNEAFAMTPDGRQLITSQRNQNNLQIFDTRTGEIIEEADVDVTVLRTVSANRHPWVAYTAHNTPGFGLVNANDLSRRYWVPTEAESRAIRFSENDRYLALSDRRGDVELWELDDAPPLEGTSSNKLRSLPQIRSKGLLAGLRGIVHDITVNRSGDIYSVSTDGAIERFSPLRKDLRMDTHTLPLAHQVAFADDGQIAVSVSHQGWLMRSQTPSHRVQQGPKASPTRILQSHAVVGDVAVSADQRRMAVILPNNQLYVYQTDKVDGKWQPVLDSERHFQVSRLGGTEVSCKVQLSSSGRFVAATTDDNCLSIFDLQSSDTNPACFRSYENDQSSFAFSPDEQLCICTGFSGVELFEIQSNRTRYFNHKMSNIRSVAFNPESDGVLVGTSDGAIQCVDTTAGKVIYTLHGIDSDGQYSPWVSSLEFYAKDRLATLTDSGQLQFWDLDQRMQLGSLDVHDGGESKSPVRKIQWLPKARQLAVVLDTPSHTRLIRWSVSEDITSPPLLTQ